MPMPRRCLGLERGEKVQQRRSRTQHDDLPRSCVLDSHGQPVGLNPLKGPFSQRGPGRNLNTVEEAGLRRLGERAFAGHFDIEIPLGLDGTQPDHSHPGPGDDRGAKMTVELNDACQPCRIGWLAMVMGLGQPVFCVAEVY